MQRFKNILFILTENNNEEALKRAEAIISSNKGRLTLVKVLPKVPERILSRLNTSYRIDIQELAAQEFKRSMTDLLTPLLSKGLDVHGRFLFGNPFLEIIRQVLKKQHDLVITTAEENGFSKAAIFGSTAMHLLRKCPCPVWVEQPASGKTCCKIMAAVDPDPSDEKRHGLNARILDLATSLALSSPAELHIIHCWHLPMEGTLRARQEFAGETVDSMIQDLLEMHKRRVENLLATQDFQGITPHIHLLKGGAGSLIPEIADDLGIDLVVMGTVCRTGIAGFFIGNTAEKVLQDIHCSVLAIKPEGFQTPVTLE